MANGDARDPIIKNIIIDHWRENSGRVPAFGGIIGYVLVLIAGYGGTPIVVLMGGPRSHRAPEAW
jgi:hypothetical protein